MYAYSNNGLSFRSVDNDHVAQNDEVVFDHIASQTELKKAFKGFVAAYAELARTPLVIAAKAALAKNDVTASRCFKKKIEFPEEWRAYDDALRAIVTGEDVVSQTLPNCPETYPSGT